MKKKTKCISDEHLSRLHYKLFQHRLSAGWNCSFIFDQHSKCINFDRHIVWFKRFKKVIE